MKLKVILELETLEQVGIILATVKPWEINVDVAPIIEAKPRRRSYQRHKKKPKRSNTSSPDTLVKLTGNVPTSRTALFKKVSKKVKEPITRLDLARLVAKEIGHENTKQTSTMVTKWIEQGALSHE